MEKNKTNQKNNNKTAGELLLSTKFYKGADTHLTQSILRTEDPKKKFVDVYHSIGTQNRLNKPEV